MSSNKKSLAKPSYEALSSVTRSLAVNVYLLWHQGLEIPVEDWFRGLNERFSEALLSDFLVGLGESVGAKIINVSSTPYEPFGASAALLVGQNAQPVSTHQLVHLNASHIAAHSYFDCSEKYAQFRLEIEVSTCGNTHPYQIVGDILEKTNADFVQLDYRTRGLVWRMDGEPELASDDLELMCRDIRQISAEKYAVQINPQIGRNGFYAELTKVNLDSVNARLIAQLH